MEAENLSDYHSVWTRKPVLRAVYGDLFDRMLALRVPGPGLEIGGGVGGLKARAPDLISSDIQHASWLDLVADAQCLPFGDETLATIMMLDVLHHIEFPYKFFAEAQRALKPGGRLIMLDPAITPGSSAFYRFIHQEPVRMACDPLANGAPDPDRNPYDSNQAIPTLIATRDKARFHKEFPQLRITQTDWFSFFVYPLSGGFQPWSLINERAAKPLIALENALAKPLGRLFGFRLLISIDKLAS